MLIKLFKDELIDQTNHCVTHHYRPTPHKKMAYKILLTVAFCAAAVSAVPWVGEPRDDAWVHHHEQLVNLTRAHTTEIKAVFFGDSITAGWAGNGKQIWHDHYATRGSYNYGIGGDRTEHLVWRIAHGEFEDIKPKVIVLKIGTNNISHKDNATAIAKGISQILDDLHKKMPDAKVILCSVLPRATTAMDTEVQEINKLISRFADNKRIHYLDLAVHFEVSLAVEKEELFNADKLHLSVKGYEMWYKVMEPTFAKLLAE